MVADDIAKSKGYINNRSKKILFNKKIIIHAGPGKTGSSSIQKWMNENSQKLKSFGVMYPRHRLDMNGIGSGNVSSILSRSEKGGWKINYDKLNKILSNFRSSECNTLILSSEFFFPYVEQIAEIIPESEFVFYIRNPLEVFESTYNQTVKRNGVIRRMKIPKEIDLGIFQNVLFLYKKLGLSRVHLRPYLKDKWHNKSIISDFLYVFGIDENIENVVVNSSYTLPALEMKRLLNHFEFDFLDKRIDKVLQSYNGGCQSYSFIPENRLAKIKSNMLTHCEALLVDFESHITSSILEVFQGVSNKRYFDQKTTCEELMLLADFIKKEDSSLFRHLQRHINSNKNILVDKQIFDVFGVSAEPYFFSDDKFLAKTKALSDYPVKRGRALSALGMYYLESKDLNNAVLFLGAAYELLPQNEVFKERLNHALLKRNDQRVFSRNKMMNITYNFIKKMYRKI